jgi:S1-C subfamily serine protease
MEFKARGVEIVQVFKGSRAAQAGLQQGDILREVGDEPFNEIMDLHHAAIQAMQSSQPLALTIERDGQKLSLNLNLQRPKRCPDEL